jgi:hypothetical protein
MSHLRVTLLLLALAACKRGSTKNLVTHTFAFEGEIEQESHFLTGITNRATYKMRGEKVRVDMPSTVMLADLGARKSYMLDSAAKTYTTVDWGKMMTVDAAAPARIKTGKKDVVAGYRCEEYEYTTIAGEKAVSCITTEIYGPIAMAAGAVGAFSDDLGFPLRTVIRNASGTEVFRTEVTRIEKKPVPESDVSIPPGYKEVR